MFKTWHFPFRRVAEPIFLQEPGALLKDLRGSLLWSLWDIPGKLFARPTGNNGDIPCASKWSYSSPLSQTPTYKICVQGSAHHATL